MASPVCDPPNNRMQPTNQSSLRSRKELQARLVIVEGIMGSGKSTTAQCIATRLQSAGQPTQAVTDMTRPHPVRATDGLSHRYQPWLDITPAGLAVRSPTKWQSFVAAQTAATAHVLDGQLFHGDLTNLFLMDAGSAAIVKYTQAVEETVRPLTPLLSSLQSEECRRGDPRYRDRARPGMGQIPGEAVCDRHRRRPLRAFASGV